MELKTKYIKDVIPNVNYELGVYLEEATFVSDVEKKEICSDINKWKEYIKEHNTPFRKFFVVLTDEGKEKIKNFYEEKDDKILIVMEILKLLDKKYKELNWSYSDISNKEINSITLDYSISDKYYMEIHDLKYYKIQEIA